MLLASCSGPEAPSVADTDATTSGKPVPLDAYVTGSFPHGVPYESAVAYGPGAVPRLRELLEDPEQQRYWSTVASVLAMIAEPAGVAAVIEFVEQGDAHAVGEAYVWARGNAVLALGYAAYRHRSEAALEYLLQSLDPEIWRVRGVSGAQGESATSDEGTVDSQLTEQALLGLALSGTAEAAKALDAFATDASRAPGLRKVAVSAIGEHAKIVADGLLEYDRRRIRG